MTNWQSLAATIWGHGHASSVEKHFRYLDRAEDFKN